MTLLMKGGMQICVPTQGAQDWRRFLARESHWREGYSAMALAQCWETSLREKGAWPSEVGRILLPMNALLAIPEFKVYLPPLSGRPSQSDLFVLAEESEGLVAVMVEGKVNETFGPTLAERRLDPSPGVAERISYILDLLELPADIPGTIRYQLLHRTAAAIHTAVQYHAYRAVVLVHSFSQAQPHGMWFEDFHAFGSLFGNDLHAERLENVGTFAGIEVDLGWTRGEERFLKALV